MLGNFSCFCCRSLVVFKKLFQEHYLSAEHKSRGYNKTFLHSVKAVTLIFTSGRGSAFSSAKQGKSGSL